MSAHLLDKSLLQHVQPKLAYTQQIRMKPGDLDTHPRTVKLCCEFVECVVAFVHEMNVSMYHDDLYKHRLAATKYLLAIVYETFMVITGGNLSKVSVCL